MNTSKLLSTLAWLLFIMSCNDGSASSGDNDVNAIPYPLKKWEGVQGKVLAESKPAFVGPPKVKEGAPNVMVIMLDDSGYSNAGSYGGAFKTPNVDRLGDEGIRYTDMHLAAICCPQHFGKI